MKKDDKRIIITRIICFVLAAMMILGGATYSIYALFGAF